VVIQSSKSLVVTKIANPSVTDLVNVGKMKKIESLILHYFFVGSGLAFLIQFFENGMILLQNAVDFSYIFVMAAQFFIVIGIPASVAAKFLVGPSPQWFSAFQTISFVHFLVLNKNIKSR
jgi:hypothetical protein